MLLFCTRNCQGLWVAAYWGLSQPWGILLVRDSCSCRTGFHSAFKRKRPLDRNSDLINCAVNYSFSHNWFYKLAKAGNQGKGKNAIKAKKIMSQGKYSVENEQD
ncbi:hypothetical protein RJ639_020274 [Escallonia herrerae]|uniref:Uncharacterized protein n=1 Tax=Escallonia herrerae TaxID=1293975 RepID=A0AA89AGY9_9ASTE|nr:hypothetical protein RJ639_020274 [Escallonia herrerae]